jgi:post-segregation antitoxin (ccd killing protein)
MRTTERVTVTLPREVVRDIAQIEPNRSRFVLEAVHHEIRRRKHDELRRSLRNPHPDSAVLTEAGGDPRAKVPPDEETHHVVDTSTGKPVRWTPGKGWAERRK